METLYHFIGMFVFWGFCLALTVLFIALMRHYFDCLMFSKRIKKQFPNHWTWYFAWKIFWNTPTNVYVNGVKFTFIEGDE